MSAERCGYAITDEDGEMAPCDRVATGHRWYQDVGEHEDMLDVACEWHANEGGRRLAAVTAATDDAARHLGHAHPVVLALRKALGAS